MLTRTSRNKKAGIHKEKRDFVHSAADACLASLRCSGMIQDKRNPFCREGGCYNCEVEIVEAADLVSEIPPLSERKHAGNALEIAQCFVHELIRLSRPEESGDRHNF